MFDIGFSELLLIAVVALIVIGPERLPGVARTLGHLFGRMQRYVNDVKADIAREMELEELRKLRSSMEDAARSFESSVSKELSETESELSKLADLPEPAGPGAEASAGSTAGATPSSAPGSASGQLELGLDPQQQAPAQKRA